MSGGEGKMQAARRWDRLATALAGMTRGAAALVVVAALGLAAVSALLAANRLGIDTETTDMISEEVPFRRNYETYAAAFPQFTDQIAVVLDGPRSAPVEEMADALADRLGDVPRLFKSVYRPGGEAFFLQNGLLFLDLGALSQLGDRLAEAQPLMAKLNQDPSLVGMFSLLGQTASAAVEGGRTVPAGPLYARIAEIIERAANGRPGRLDWQGLIAGDALPGTSADDESARQFILAQPVLDYASLKPASKALEHIRETAATLDLAGAGVRLRLTGGAALAQEELDSAMRGVAFAGVVSLVLVALLLVVGLGAWQLVAAVLVTLLTGLVWTAGFATLAIGHLNLISAAFAVLFVGLAVDFGIHMALRYREAIAEGAGEGVTARAAAVQHALGRALRGAGPPIALTAAAAAIGFFAFVPTDYRGLSELGVIAGAGMMIALAANLTLLPALLTLLPRPVVKRARNGRLAEAATSLAGKRAWPVLVLTAVLAILAMAALPGVRFDFNPLNLQNPALESVATFRDLAANPDQSPYRISILAENEASALALAARLDALPEVKHALTARSYVPENQAAKLALIDEMALFLTPVLMPGPAAARPGADAIRRAAGAAARHLTALAESEEAGSLAAPARRLADALGQVGRMEDAALADLHRRLLGGWPRQRDRLRAALGADTVTFADLPDALRERMVAADGRWRIDVAPAGDVSNNRAMRRFVRAVSALAPNATGTPVIVVEAGREVVRAFREAGIIAFIAIAILLALTLRRWRDSVLVLIPVALAGLLTGAASALAALPFNFANVIVLPLLLGLGVAGGIHLVTRVRGGHSAALHATSTPRAVLFSALTTIASFGSLALSEHRGTASMGALLTIALLFTLFATLIVLPALIKVWNGRRVGKLAQGGRAARNDS